MKGLEKMKVIKFIDKLPQDTKFLIYENNQKLIDLFEYDCIPLDILFADIAKTYPHVVKGIVIIDLHII